MEEVLVPVAPVDPELWFEETQRDFPNRKQRFLEIAQPNSEEFCTPEILSLLNNSFSPEEIEEVLRAGFLRGIRIENIFLQKYPHVKKAAEKIDQELRSNAIRSIKAILEEQGTAVEQRREDVIAVIHAVVLAGLEFNAKGQNGRALIHEMLSLHDPSNVLSGDPTVYVFLRDSKDFIVDWKIEDERGLTLRRYAIHEGKDSFALYLISRSDLSYESLSMEGYIKVIKREMPEQLRKEEESSELDDELRYVREASRFTFRPHGRAFLIGAIPKWRSLSRDFAKINSSSKLRRGLDNLLSTLNDYCFEFEIGKVLGVEEKSSIDVSVHSSVANENIDLVGKYPHVVNVIYARARKAVSGDFSELFDEQHVIYALKLAQHQIEKNSNSGFSRFVLFFRNFKHKRMRASVLNYIQKQLWANKDKAISIISLNLLNEFSLEDIQRVLMSTDWKGKTLLSYIKDKEINPKTMLHWFLSPEVAEFLIKEGVDVNSSDPSGSTPLHTACKEGNYALARCLVRNGADVLALNNKGATPLECIDWHWNTPREKCEQRWKKYLEIKMGLTLENLAFLKQIKLTPREFLELPALLRGKIIESPFSVTEILKRSGISFQELCKLDLTQDKRAIVNLINKLEEWNRALPSPYEIEDLDRIKIQLKDELNKIFSTNVKRNAQLIGLSHQDASDAQKQTGFFEGLPYEVLVRVASHTTLNPKFVSVKAADKIARKTITEITTPVVDGRTLRK